MFEGMSVIEILKLLAPLLVVQLSLILFCLYRLTKDEVRFIPKWGWALVILFVNFVGPIIYLLVGRERD